MARNRLLPAPAAARRLSVLALVVLCITAWNLNAASAASADAGSSAKEWSNEKQGVHVLNVTNFDSSLRDGKVWLIEFYAPWCGHCTRFAPIYTNVAKDLHHRQKVNKKNTGKDVREVNVAKVDGDKERALSSRFSVGSFPSFFLVDGWTVREFSGARSHDGLVKFALEDYEKTDPVPFLFGPFGPMGQTRAILMRTGTYVVGMYEFLTKDKGMKPLVAMAVLCSGGTFLGLVGIVVLGLLFLPKVKTD